MYNYFPRSQLEKKGLNNTFWVYFKDNQNITHHGHFQYTRVLRRNWKSIQFHYWRKSYRGSRYWQNTLTAFPTRYCIIQIFLKLLFNRHTTMEKNCHETYNTVHTFKCLFKALTLLCCCYYMNTEIENIIILLILLYQELNLICLTLRYWIISCFSSIW